MCPSENLTLLLYVSLTQKRTVWRRKKNTTWPESSKTFMEWNPTKYEWWSFPMKMLHNSVILGFMRAVNFYNNTNCVTFWKCPQNHEKTAVGGAKPWSCPKTNYLGINQFPFMRFKSCHFLVHFPPQPCSTKLQIRGTRWTIIKSSWLDGLENS